MLHKLHNQETEGCDVVVPQSYNINRRVISGGSCLEVKHSEEQNAVPDGIPVVTNVEKPENKSFSESQEVNNTFETNPEESAVGEAELKDATSLAGNKDPYFRFSLRKVPEKRVYNSGRSRTNSINRPYSSDRGNSTLSKLIPSQVSYLKKGQFEGTLGIQRNKGRQRKQSIPYSHPDKSRSYRHGWHSSAMIQRRSLNSKNQYTSARYSNVPEKTFLQRKRLISEQLSGKSRRNRCLEPFPR